MSRRIARRPMNAGAGFTLIEVLASLAILSGVIVTVVYTLNYHMTIVHRIKQEQIATLLAREKIEDINLNGLPREKEGVFSRPYEMFSWSYVIGEMPVAGIEKINLTIGWSEKGGALSVETYRFTGEAVSLKGI